MYILCYNIHELQKIFFTWWLHKLTILLFSIHVSLFISLKFIFLNFLLLL